MDVEELLLKILSFDTQNPPGKTGELGAFLEKLLKQHGFETARVYYGREEAFDLLAWKGSPGFAVLAHMDTVPFGEGWNYSPLGERVGARIYGRGAVDTKGGLAAALFAALRAENAFLIFTSDEETSLAGARALKSQEIPDFVFVTEPTGMKIGIAHKGVLWAKVKLEGRAAHGSMPEKGENAIYKACRLMNDLEKLPRARDPLLGSTTYNVGVIRGGSKINVVPDFCELSIDFRTVSNEAEEIIEFLKSYGGVEVIERLPPFKGSRKLAEVTKIALSKVGIVPELKALPYYTEAGVLSTFGKKCIVIGPGREELAHASNEYITSQELRKAAAFYSELFNFWPLVE